jgi:uncharacterized membrane-anchored protein YhcB (DUF1043 family)
MTTGNGFVITLIFGSSTRRRMQSRRKMNEELTKQKAELEKQKVDLERRKANLTAENAVIKDHSPWKQNRNRRRIFSPAFFY